MGRHRDPLRRAALDAGTSFLRMTDVFGMFKHTRAFVESRICCKSHKAERWVEPSTAVVKAARSALSLSALSKISVHVLK